MFSSLKKGRILLISFIVSEADILKKPKNNQFASIWIHISYSSLIRKRDTGNLVSQTCLSAYGESLKITPPFFYDSIE